MFGMLEAADEDRIRAIVRKVLAENPAAAGSEASGSGTCTCGRVLARGAYHLLYVGLKALFVRLV